MPADWHASVSDLNVVAVMFSVFAMISSYIECKCIFYFGIMCIFAQHFFHNKTNITMKTDENEAYHRDLTRISKSKLDVIAKSPLHFWAKFLDPNRVPEPPTEWGTTGNAVHTAILEPHKFDRRFVVMPENAPKKPTSAQINAKNPSADTVTAIEWYARFHEANKGKSILSAEDYRDVRGMQDAVFKHPAAMALLVTDDIIAEETIEFDEPHTGEPCKLRRDAFNKRYGLTLDLKTTENASPSEFARSVNSYRYHVQDAFYTDGHLAKFGENTNGFVFIAVEKKAPYAVAVYQLTNRAVQLGRELYIRDINTYQECRRTGIWRGYSDEVEPLDLPQWAYRI